MWYTIVRIIIELNLLDILSLVLETATSLLYHQKPHTQWYSIRFQMNEWFPYSVYTTIMDVHVICVFSMFIMDQYKMIDMLVLGWCSINDLHFFFCEVPHKNIGKDIQLF
jgi:hypothetical protein